MKSYAILNQNNLFLSIEELKAIIDSDEIEYYHGVALFNKESNNVAKRSSLIKYSGRVIVISHDVNEIIKNIKGECFSVDPTVITKEYKSEFLSIYERITNNIKLSKKCKKMDLIFTEGLIIAGLRVEEKDNESLFKHSKKPYSQSGTLSPDIGRLMVNLSKSRKMILDPFVGTGTILIEAKWLGLNCFGLDVDSKMIEKSLINLRYFGYECDILRGDATSLPFNNVEAIVTDPPYGRSLSVKEGINNLYEGFFYSASNITRTLVFTTDSKLDWRDKLKEVGFNDISIHFIYEHKSLSRAIYVVRKK
ncbi:RNA methyltransferase [Sulfolobus sp. S-194]|uniref:TRM11 family SAM-dependent methyltransferase n=1 Tax=Sulfolobus sp. S-194 TaxID=2512240 RepID=UPI0014372DBD|nr:DNA methyltransferase [Sulfolobus sp. S-194]QIW24056.1 RNA methyltransferase [Sulfolobus sp. S-194]